jgi:pimeloyl-ACP methyl ester carboxylesterase
MGEGRRLTDRVGAPDGRQISIQVSGDPEGSPVILLHGTPGSRVGPYPRGQLLHRMGVKLITFDRPGYGGSDRLPGRQVADVAGDVAAIADHLGISRFAVVGRSGGGPHALACAALLPDRVSRAAVLVGLAPQGAEGLDWFDGMVESNVLHFTAAGAGLGPLAGRLMASADAFHADPASLIDGLLANLTDDDLTVVADPGIRAMLIRSYQEALRTSVDGWIDDARAFCRPWGFDPATVTVPVLLWHGDRDMFSPVAHARWLGARIPDATLVVKSGAAHLGALKVLPDVLRMLVADVPSL